VERDVRGVVTGLEWFIAIRKCFFSSIGIHVGIAAPKKNEDGRRGVYRWGIGPAGLANA
jgi:hypothetical protein